MPSKYWPSVCRTARLSALCFALAAYAFATEVDVLDDLSARIELELLADPLTFPYSWQVQVRNNAVEISGAVPDDTIRERALQVAGQVTSLTINDRIFLHHGPRVSKSPPRSARELGEAVQQRLHQAGLGGAAGTAEVDIYPDASGLVTLRGRVPTLHDKLLASRCLRNLPNCIAVRNFLAIDPRLNQSPSMPGQHVPTGGSDDRVSDPFLWRPPHFITPPRSPQPHLYPGAWMPQFANRIPKYPSMRGLISNISTHTGMLSPAQSSTYSVPLATSEMVGQTVYQSTQAPQPGSVASKQLSAESGLLAPLAGYQDLPKPSQSRNRVSQAWVQPAIEPNIYSKSAHSIGYPSARGLPSVPKASAVDSHMTHVASASPSNIIPAVSEQVPVPSFSTPHNDDPQALRQRILSALGGTASDVQIYTLPDKTLRIKVLVSSTNAIDKAATRLFQMPEIQGYQIKPEFEVSSIPGR